MKTEEEVGGNIRMKENGNRQKGKDIAGAVLKSKLECVFVLENHWRRQVSVKHSSECKWNRRDKEESFFDSYSFPPSLPPPSPPLKSFLLLFIFLKLAFFWTLLLLRSYLTSNWNGGNWIPFNLVCKTTRHFFEKICFTVPPREAANKQR